ncbi:hypothetical protein BH18ACI2_BH18ACI2_13150 [soil metagenome]
MVNVAANELDSRYRVALLAVVGMLVLTALLIVLAYTDVLPALPSSLVNAASYGAIWITILFCGLGAVALRRTAFAAMRLRDIAAVKGVSELLTTLQKTTILVALIGGVISVLGYILTAMTNDVTNMRNAGIIALAVLFYGFPRRSAWQRVVQATQPPVPPPPADNLPSSSTSPAKGTIA